MRPGSEARTGRRTFHHDGLAAFGGALTVILHLQPGPHSAPVGASHGPHPCVFFCPAPPPPLQPEPFVRGFHAGSGGLSPLTAGLPSSSWFNPLWLLPPRDLPGASCWAPCPGRSSDFEMERWWLRRGPYRSWSSCSRLLSQLQPRQMAQVGESPLGTVSQRSLVRNLL